MRVKAKIDQNQKDIVSALRGVGCTVQSLATIGNGCPDILVGRAGQNYLMEIKDGSKPPSQRQLTGDQETWWNRWNGSVMLIESVDQALAAVGIKGRRK